MENKEKQEVTVSLYDSKGHTKSCTNIIYDVDCTWFDIMDGFITQLTLLGYSINKNTLTTWINESEVL